MTPLINFENPMAVLSATVLFVLFILLAKETKNSLIMGVILGAFLVIIAGHAIELSLIEKEFVDVQRTIAKCITYDFLFIALSFFSYLWIDDIEAKDKKKKSLNNSLDWFWSKI